MRIGDDISLLDKIEEHFEKYMLMSRQDFERYKELYEK